MPTKTILVVEDSLELADTICDALSLRGYRALTAPTGSEAIATAKSEHPDLILLDIRLPDMSGYEVFFNIREDTWGVTARFLILSAAEAVDVIAKNVHIPSTDILFKPRTSISDLLGHIDRILTTPAQAES